MDNQDDMTEADKVVDEVLATMQAIAVAVFIRMATTPYERRMLGIGCNTN